MSEYDPLFMQFFHGHRQHKSSPEPEMSPEMKALHSYNMHLRGLLFEQNERIRKLENAAHKQTMTTPSKVVGG